MGPQRIAGLKMNQNQIDQLAAVFRRDSLITEDNVVEAGLAKRNFDLAELNRELQRRFSSPSTGVVDCAVSKEKELSLRFKSYQELQDAISTGKVRVYDRVRIYKIKQKLGSKYVETHSNYPTDATVLGVDSERGIIELGNFDNTLRFGVGKAEYVKIDPNVEELDIKVIRS